MAYDELDQREEWDADENLPGVRHYVRQWRDFRKITQAKLARMVGTNSSMISLIETGQRGLGDRWVYKIAKALDTSPGSLFDENPFDNISNDHSRVLNVWDSISDESQPRAMTVLEAFAETAPRVVKLKDVKKERAEAASKETKNPQASCGDESPQGI